VLLVDLPGYGYAPASAELAGIADSYFASGDSRGALLLVDSRHPALPADTAAGAWLNRIGVRYELVATKIDKLSRTERARNLKTLETSFAMPALPVSAASGEGMDELWRTIARLARTAE
jgi:GTP-binding protein